MEINYEVNFKIELLNEFSNRVYGRLLNFILNNGMATDDTRNPYSALLMQFKKMLNLPVEDMSLEELEALKHYWRSMNAYIEGLEKVKSA